tara:strand:+ start:196 stop:426 length:231 start_codon:yes stop_codon:yes gene_type:complete
MDWQAPIQPTLKDVRIAASKIGLIVEADRDVVGWAYWLLNPDGSAPFANDNFHTTRDSVLSRVDEISDNDEPRGRF